MLERWSRFLHEDLWRIRLNRLPRGKSWQFRMLRILFLSVRGFNRDKCKQRASALTYYSLLSIVPVMAMAFGIAKGFGLEQNLELLIRQRLRAQEEVVQWILNFARSFLDNTQGGLVAGVGIVLLFWSIISALGEIENAFNDIWGIKKGRSFGRKLSDYMSMMLICPVLLIVSSSMTVFITTQVTALMERHTTFGYLSPVVGFGLGLLPLAVGWMLFIFIYMFVPNTKVSTRSGVVAGIAAGTVYQVVQWAYITFQVGVASYNAVYGSFAALPLFLVWLQTSWLVVLFGAEMSFAIDNEETYEFERDCLEVSQRFKRLLALRLTEIAVKHFAKGEPPLSAKEMAHQLDAPIRLVRELLYELVAARVLIEVRPDSGNLADGVYQPTQDVERLTIKAVLDALEKRGKSSVPLMRDRELEHLSAILDAFDELIAKSPKNVPLKDL